MKRFVCVHLNTAFLLLLLTTAHCSATVCDFKDWAPLETNADSVYISAADTSMLVDSHRSARVIERHVKSITDRFAIPGTAGANWSPKMNLYGAGLSLLMQNEEQYYVQFSMRIDDMTAAVFESFTGRPLMSMVADRAFVAVGCKAWMQRALIFPGVAFVSARRHESKVSSLLKFCA